MKAPLFVRSVLLRMLKATGAKCPACGAEIGLPEPAKDLKPEQVVQCGECHRYASLTEIAVRWRGEPVGTADLSTPPAGTRITKRELKGGGVAWEVPPSGRSGGFFFFGIFWLAISVIVTSGMVGSVLKGEEPLYGMLFGLFFIMIGLVILYFGLRGKYARHLIIVNSEAVMLGRSLFGHSKMKSLARSTVTSVMKKVFYEQNYQPVHGVEIRSARGKLRFGSMLEEEEKDWLVAELRRELELHKVEGASPPAEGLARAQGQFVLQFPAQNTRNAFMSSLIFTLVGVGFFAVAYFGLREAAVFRLIWLAGSGLFVLVGLCAMVVTIRRAGTIVEVVGMPHEVACRTRRGLRVLEEDRIARDELVAVRCFDTGRSNSLPSYVFELVGRERSLPVVFHHSSPELPGLACELGGKLGL